MSLPKFIVGRLVEVGPKLISNVGNPEEGGTRIVGRGVGEGGF